jgi:hypothetical protein
MIKETELKKLASDIRLLIYNQYTLAIAAHTAPNYDYVFEDMQRLQPGDLVAEISTILIPKKDLQAVGYFIKTVDEKIYPNAEDPRDRKITDKFTYIKCLDGTEQRWENCNFVKGFMKRS